MIAPLVSIIIPTFNGRYRVPEVLEALSKQDLAASAFEVLVIDNASQDGTGPAIDSDPLAIAMRQKGTDVSVIPEPIAGATYARITGARRAKGQFLCLLDDDNLPEPDFLTNGIREMSDENVGLVVSRVFPRYLSAPSAAVKRRAHLLAINDYLGEKRVVFSPGNSFVPSITAGLWVKREAFLQAIPCDRPESLLADRQGSSLRCGGDIEMGLLIGRAGFGRVFSPELRVAHVIGPGRLTRKYMIRLITAIIRSEATLDERYLGIRNTPMKQMKALGSFILRVICAPLLLLRKDGVNETCFVIAAGWAKLAGPYHS